VDLVSPAGGKALLHVRFAGKLRELEVRKRQIAEELSDLRPLPRLAPEIVNSRLGEWRRLLRGSLTQGRQVLDRVLAGRIVFTPTKDMTGCTFRAPTRFGRLFEGYASKAMKQLREVPDWREGAPADDPIDREHPDLNYGRLLDRAVQRLQMNRTRDSSPRGRQEGRQWQPATVLVGIAA
jgi:hypothetical protein